MIDTPAASAPSGGRPIVMSVGTDALLAIADAAASLPRTPRPAARPEPDWGWSSPFLRAAASTPGVTADEVEEAFPGATVDPAASEFDDLVRAFAAGEAQPWRQIVELRGLRAAAAEMPPGPVGALIVDSPGGRLLAHALTVLMQSAGWSPRLGFVRALRPHMSPEDARTALAALEPALHSDQSAAGPLAMIAGGSADVAVLLTIFALRARLDLVHVVTGEDDDTPRLAYVVHADDAANTVSSSVFDQIAIIAAGSLQAWQRTPHEVRRAGLGSPALASATARSRMAARTREWVVGDLWQADRIPQIVHHGVEHGRRVDTVSNELLTRCSFVSTDLDDDERDAAVEALSAASWLHDVGQRGGFLAGRYVADQEHVRAIHGLLSTLILERESGDLGLEDPALLWATCQLALRHQRIFALTEADAGAATFAGCAVHRLGRPCPICAEVLDRIAGNTLATQYEHQSRRGRPTGVREQNAVRLGALLRVADAADIGMHRVNGRWFSRSRHGIEDAWRRDFAWELSNEAVRLGLDEGAQQVLQELVAEADWPEWLQARAIRELEAAGAPGMALRVAEYETFLDKQQEYVSKHRYFHGAQVLDAGPGLFAVGLRPSQAWEDASADERDLWFGRSASYIWDEYRDSSMYFEAGPLAPLPGMAALAAVLGPDGRSMRREDEVVAAAFAIEATG